MFLLSPHSFLLIFALFIFASTSLYAQPKRSVTLNEFLNKRNSVSGEAVNAASRKGSISLESLCPAATDALASRVFREYGSVFAASENVVIPNTCIFADSNSVGSYQRSLKTRSALIGGVAIELQEPAMESLLRSLGEAANKGRRITPLDGAIAGKRSYDETVTIWNSRFEPALRYWTRRGRISNVEAVAARSMTIVDQARKVLEWEPKGLYFSTNFSMSIFSSTAPPGTSQHLSMLAFDVVEYGDRDVRTILNRNGWFQTVRNDPPHFTYLGVSENELTSRGLRPVKSGGYKFWVPNLD